MNLDGFFQQWVWSDGHPVLTVDMSASKGLLVVGVNQTQTGEGTPEAYHFDLPIEVVYDDGERQRVCFPVRDRERSFAVPISRKVNAVRVDPGFSVQAVVTLKASGDWLKQNLNDECPLLAARAADALVDAGSADGLNAVWKALLEHSFWAVRGHIARTLGSLGGSDNRDALLEALATEAEPRVRESILTALGEFREEAVATALMATVSPNDTWHVQGAAILSLGKTRDPRAQHIFEATSGRRLGKRCSRLGR